MRSRSARATSPAPSLSYGTVTYAPGTPHGQFVVDAAPHVAMRLKRAFPQASVRHKKVALADTAETGRELLWFCERFPLTFVGTARAQLERRDREHRDREQAVARILGGSGDYTPPNAVPFAVPPRQYQSQAGALVLRTGRLLLADDLGTGKTVSALTVLSDPAALPALVVTPTSLPGQWERQIKRFLPSLRVHVLKGTKPYPLDSVDSAKGSDQATLPGVGPRLPDVIVTSYSKLAGWGGALAGRVKTVVFDEVHELRTGTGGYRNDAAALIASHARYKLGLSATPVWGYAGEEFFNVLSVLAPDEIGTRAEFVREWCKDGSGKAKIANPDAFGAHLRAEGLLLRRTRAEVGRELPPLTVVPCEIAADLAALASVEASVAELARILVSQSGHTNFDRMRAAGELDWRLRQATGIAKAPYAAEFIKLLVEGGERKILAFAWHREVYRILVDRLKPFKVVLYTGEETTAEKNAAYEAFVEGDAHVLLMSLRSGTGLDGLQRVCRTVVFVEQDWSPKVHEQGIGRVHRDEQPDPVVAYQLTTDCGSDPIVAEICGIKKRQIEPIVNPGLPMVEPVAEVNQAHVRQLAEAVLRRQGVALPVAAGTL